MLKDIRVEGLQRSDAGTVFASLPFRIGDTYNDDEGRRRAARAVRHRPVQRRAHRHRRRLVVVIVEERPVIAAVDFVGLKEFEGHPGQVAEGLRHRRGPALRQGAGRPRRAGAQAPVPDAQPVRRRGGDHGDAAERNRVNVTFTITEGGGEDQELRIVGNKAFSEGRCKGLFDLNHGGWLNWYTKADRYSRAKLNADLETLRSYYLNRGYLEFNVDSTQVAISPDKQGHHHHHQHLTEGQPLHGHRVRWKATSSARKRFKTLVKIRPASPTAATR